MTRRFLRLLAEDFRRWHASWIVKRMTVANSRLNRHLATAVAVKLVLLAVLWWLFVRDTHVTADTEQTAAHVAGTPSVRGANP